MTAVQTPPVITPEHRENFWEQAAWAAPAVSCAHFLAVAGCLHFRVPLLMCIPLAVVAWAAVVIAVLATVSGALSVCAAGCAVLYLGWYCQALVLSPWTGRSVELLAGVTVAAGLWWGGGGEGEGRRGG
jgi:hypothetical protein